MFTRGTHTAVAVAAVVGWAASLYGQAPAPVQSDLDTLMAEVVERRDENWKKLQQYVFDEREAVDLIGPGRTRLWGDRREYTWYIREGFFIRSPRSANGVAISESDRLKYETDLLGRLRVRDARERERQEREAAGRDDTPLPADAPTVENVSGLLSQTRRPQFIDSAYFLKFKFEPGRYAFVGRESLEGQEVLRVEYYPGRLFAHEQDQQDDRRKRERNDQHEDVEAELERQMNKVSLVTLWIEPRARQIVKYTFDNVDLDFLPVPWLVRPDEIKASMTMTQAFAGVWLPRHIDLSVSLMLAIGPIDFKYAIDYQEYRQPDTAGRLGRTASE